MANDQQKLQKTHETLEQTVTSIATQQKELQDQLSELTVFLKKQLSGTTDDDLMSNASVDTERGLPASPKRATSGPGDMLRGSNAKGGTATPKKTTQGADEIFPPEHSSAVAADIHCMSHCWRRASGQHRYEFTYVCMVACA